MASASKRFLKLAGMTASLASKSVTTTLKHRNSTAEEKQLAQQRLYRELGEQVAATLGEMKGAAMKVGQMISQYQDLLPAEFAEALAPLQQSAEPIAFDQVRPQIERELGRPIGQLFKSIEPTPFAAASIGQVHRAVMPDGQPVVVKVQYPDVAQNCESDLKQLRMLLRLMRVVNVDKAAQDTIFKELRDSLYAELDYTLEAHHLDIFRTFHRDLDNKLVIPRVIASHSGRRVLTLSEELGDTLAQAANYAEPVRDEIAQRLGTMICQQLFALQRFHCDPHAGNFAFRPDGTVVVYDFGATKAMSAHVLSAISDLVLAARAGDNATVDEQLKRLNSRRKDHYFPLSEYDAWNALLVPIAARPFDFGQSKVHRDAVRLAQQSLEYIDCFQPSGEMMMLNRALVGLYWNLVQLKATVNYEPLVTGLIRLRATAA